MSVQACLRICSGCAITADKEGTPKSFWEGPASCVAICRVILVIHLFKAVNQSIKTQDQQCQWPNKPRPQTQGS